MADSKKPENFNWPNSQYFLAKISGIGPWVDLYGGLKQAKNTKNAF